MPTPSTRYAAAPPALTRPPLSAEYVTPLCQPPPRCFRPQMQKRRRRFRETPRRRPSSRAMRPHRSHRRSSNPDSRVTLVGTALAARLPAERRKCCRVLSDVARRQRRGGAPRFSRAAATTALAAFVTQPAMARFARCYRDGSAAYAQRATARPAMAERVRFADKPHASSPGVSRRCPAARRRENRTRYARAAQDAIRQQCRHTRRGGAASTPLLRHHSCSRRCARCRLKRKPTERRQRIEVPRAVLLSFLPPQRENAACRSSPFYAVLMPLPSLPFLLWL